jgi:Xaa-Pro aminopeptidase
MDTAYFHGLFGYSVGIGFPPGWYETLGFDIRADNERDLEAGMVFHVPVSLRLPGQFGVNQSQTVLITETGVDPLTTSSAALVIRR